MYKAQIVSCETIGRRSYLALVMADWILTDMTTRAEEGGKMDQFMV